MSWFRSLALDWGHQHTNRVPVEKGTRWPGSVPGNIGNMEGFQVAMYLQGWFYVSSFLILKNWNWFCFSTRSFCRCSTGCCWVSCTFLWDIWSQWTRLAQHWDLICCKSTTTIESPWEGGGSCPGLSLEFASFFCRGWDGLAPGELVACHVKYCGIKENVHKDLHIFCIFSLMRSCFIHRITILFTCSGFKWWKYLGSGCSFFCLILLLYLQPSSILALLGAALQGQLSLGLLRLAGISWHLLHYMPWWQWDWMSLARGVMEKWKSKVVVKRNLDLSAGVTGDEMQKKVAHEHIRR